MGNDRWRARVKGGRRGMLKVALFGAVEWMAVGVRNTALTVLLTRVWNAITARREQTTVKPRTTGAVAVTLGALTVEGHGGILAPPATLYAVGTVANPPDPGDPPSQIA